MADLQTHASVTIFFFDAYFERLPPLGLALLVLAGLVTLILENIRMYIGPARLLPQIFCALRIGQSGQRRFAETLVIRDRRTYFFMAPTTGVESI